MELQSTIVPRVKWKDITSEVTRAVSRSKVREGFVIVQSRHTTTALILNENEEGLVTVDIPRLLERVCPDGVHAHDREERLNAMLNEPANGVSHLRSVILSGIPPLVISNHKIQFGTWQSVIFYDFDPENHPSRTVVVQVLGIR
ncbi:MAG: hypothetical protein A3D65_01545 [Candidatus Lloydbacteria bacterium RIFCSPHIGHO2_02_FULL_50_13]|uniref:Secondary thiamine-phosphate synthase enzyme n=1 Tax=Candidatus Lloydbacteria bacterium RIFCSPHIGHO2_02_FULL_50_13 TaxID=1798661 RepID=A0A1G2D285_9BACT|nr:MAG: hypothetical protein A3D65_01545 [Candidatus Lloydbacteria bacterium RIFCSPHIGHO2_02_FULL_50_13]